MNYIPKSGGSSAALSKAELARLVSLKKKKGRRQEKRFLAEGVRLLEEALKRKIKPERLYFYEPGLSERGSAALAAFRARKVDTQSLSSRDFHRLSDTETPQGLIALFKLPDPAFNPQGLKKSKRVLILENLSDPGNVGSIIRSAVGFGFSPILLLGDCVEPYNPKLVRSTAGAIFATRLYEISLEELRQLAADSTFTLLVTELSGEPEANWLGDDQPTADRPLALAIGSESEGASADLLELADRRIRISHSPELESLNAATAAAIAMHQLRLVDR